MRVAVISAQFGNFDTPKPFPKQSVPCDYFYITEDNCPYTFYNIDNRLRAKYFKILTHREYDHDIIIWVDGNVQIKDPDFVLNMVNALEHSDVAISRHHERNSVFEEASFIVNQIKRGNLYLKKRYCINAIKSEVDRMDKNLQGLYWCGLFARKNTPKVNAAFEEWWMQNILWSNFDQCNFVDVMNKKKIDIKEVIFGEFEGNDIYERTKHKYIG